MDDHLATHKRELESLYPGVPIHTRQFDATVESEVEAVCAEAVKEYGRLDIMFANAGIGSATVFSELTGDDFMFMLKGNLLSVFLCAKYAAKAMMVTSGSKKYPGGSIVATASVAGLRSNAGSTDYSAAKAGVVSLAQTISYQLAGSGIRMNASESLPSFRLPSFLNTWRACTCFFADMIYPAVCPGIIETGMTSLMYEMARNKGTERKIGQLNPLKRGGVADEVARVALFLGSDESSYVNGQAWAVDGGLSAGHPFVPGKLA